MAVALERLDSPRTRQTKPTTARAGPRRTDPARSCGTNPTGRLSIANCSPFRSYTETSAMRISGISGPKRRCRGDNCPDLRPAYGTNPTTRSPSTNPYATETSNEHSRAAIGPQTTSRFGSRRAARGFPPRLPDPRRGPFSEEAFGGVTAQRMSTRRESPARLKMAATAGRCRGHGDRSRIASAPAAPITTCSASLGRCGERSGRSIPG